MVDCGHWFRGALAVLAVSHIFALTPLAAQELTRGEGEFRAWCARCHGMAGKGDGPISQELETPPPDLTQISKKNEGQFPAGKVRETIDGRDILMSHRSNEMPAWGNWFEYDITAGGLLKQSETKTRAEIEERIDRIVGYISSIQE